MKFADLHLHTLYSDGTYSPEELVKEAKGCGLECIAVVDHDTIAGVKEVIFFGKKYNLEVIPGIELTAEYEGTEIHILGYFIDCDSLQLKNRLKELHEIRQARIYKIIDRLNELGISLAAESVFELSQKGTTGRLHIARAMVKEGLVTNTSEAFSKYIGDNCPAYVGGFKFSPAEAIGLIKEVGGIPVLAHPYTLRRDELIPELIKYGLMGLEVYYPEHSQNEINFYSKLAAENNLLITGGSDCHGKAKPEVKLGMVKLPYTYVEKLKSARSKT